MSDIRCGLVTIRVTRESEFVAADENVSAEPVAAGLHWTGLPRTKCARVVARRNASDVGMLGA
jgi:hypothetical protein